MRNVDVDAAKEACQLPNGFGAKAVFQLLQDLRGGHPEVDHFITGQKVRRGLCVWHRLFMATLVGLYLPVMCRVQPQTAPAEICERFWETRGAGYAGR